MSETFTRRELDIAASRMGHIFSMSNVLAKAETAGESSWDEERLRYWLGYGCSWLTETIAEARRLRKPAVNAAEKITAGELQAWMDRSGIGKPRGVTFTSASEIIADIIAHREPEYPEGTMVTDAAEITWLRTPSGGWHTFGDSTIYPHSRPVRPLKVIL